MELLKGLFVVGVGFLVLGISLFYLFYRFNKIVEKQHTSISISALRVSSVLAYSGVMIIVLGLLYLIEVIPWWV